jgi:phosphonate transport system substrate-binding protein
MQTTLKRGLALTAGLALAFGLAACSSTSAPSQTPAASESTAHTDEGTFASGDDKTIVFATLPDHEGADQDAQPIADWIAEITGKDVKFFEATDYTAVVQGLAAGQIDVAQISSFTYYQAQAAGAKIEPIGAQITAEGESAGYYSVAIKKAGDATASLKDYAGQKVCFVNPTSTSGRAIPTAQLLDAGVKIPESDIVYGEEHDLTAAKVAEGTDCSVGFAQDADADPLIKEGKLEEIDRFLVPGAPIVMQAALPKDVKDVLVKELADSTAADLKAAGIASNSFLDENWFGFESVDDAYFDTIRGVCQKIADQVESCRA